MYLSQAHGAVSTVARMSGCLFERHHTAVVFAHAKASLFWLSGKGGKPHFLEANCKTSAMWFGKLCWKLPKTFQPGLSHWQGAYIFWPWTRLVCKTSGERNRPWPGTWRRYKASIAVLRCREPAHAHAAVRSNLFTGMLFRSAAWLPVVAIMGRFGLTWVSEMQFTYHILEYYIASWWN